VNLSGVVGPGDAEQDHAFGLEDPLQDPALAVAGVALENGAEARDDLLDGLVEVGLAGVLGYQVVEEILDVSGHVFLQSRRSRRRRRGREEVDGILEQQVRSARRPFGPALQVLSVRSDAGVPSPSMEESH
jgi:hypothetical protein